MKPISIGHLKFDRPVFMAPMEGITDVPFRRIVREHGCGITCTQMIHAEALIRVEQERRVKETATMVEGEKPVGLQLCSPDPALMAEAAKVAEQLGAAFIDVNMGCPAKNVVARGAGAALLQNPVQAAAVVKAIVSSVSIPVTVKIRAGWDDTYRNALEVGSALQNEGAALISVHARTRAQKFKGNADWNLIRELKSKLNVPVVGNGDVFQPEDVSRMLDDTGADGVMVARGALGNPWIFGGRRPIVREIEKTLFDHMNYHLEYYGGQDVAMMTYRKHVVWYTKGLRNSSEFRSKLFQEKAPDKTVEMLKHFFAELDPNSLPSA